MAAQDEVDVCESWEDMDEIGLEQQIKLNSNCSPVVSSVKGCKVTVEESACIGSQCVMPEPAIRILKRPTSSAGGQQNGESRARPVKTLEQRQKEYQEARLRILGEARSPEDVIDDNLSRLQDKLQANNLNESQSNKVKNDTKAKERKVLARLPLALPPQVCFPLHLLEGCLSSAPHGDQMVQKVSKGGSIVPVSRYLMSSIHAFTW